MEDRNIRVISLSGESKNFKVSSSALVSQFKHQISSVMGVPVDEQRLVFQGRILKDDKPISEYIKEDDMTIHMIRNTYTQSEPVQLPRRRERERERRPRVMDFLRQRTEDLPVSRVENMSAILDQLQGLTAGSSIPNVPQLEVEQNPVVALGDFLTQYHTQILRLLPFISRLADLCQRESLIQENMDRIRLRELARGVSRVLDELLRATSPIIPALSTTLMTRSTEPFRSVIPFIMREQLLRFPGDQNIPIRQLVNSAQDPLLEIFYALTVREINTMASGDWSPLLRIRESLQQHLMKRMEGDSLEKRKEIVERGAELFVRCFAMNERFLSQVVPGTDYERGLRALSEEWIEKVLRIVLESPGDFCSQIHVTLKLMAGHFADFVADCLMGAFISATQMTLDVVRNLLSEHLTSHAFNLVVGYLNRFVTEILYQCRNEYKDYKRKRDADFIVHDSLVEAFMPIGIVEIPPLQGFMEDIVSYLRVRVQNDSSYERGTNSNIERLCNR